MQTLKTMSPIRQPNVAFASSVVPLAITHWSRLRSSHHQVRRSSFAIGSLCNQIDGGVFEISINGGAFADVTFVGGFVCVCGYVGALNPATGNPLGGRPAWTGNSTSFFDTIVNLPASAVANRCAFAGDWEPTVPFKTETGHRYRASDE